MEKAYSRGTAVISQSGEKGVLTGGRRRCQLTGCGGKGLYVRWKDGKLTVPCTKGMTFDETNNTWKIQ